ncbi:MAG: hypothetical protein KDG50_11260 [Chromatiales bacterium]|nr:hypothetical protein [Chromatiales bacterium]
MKRVLLLAGALAVSGPAVAAIDARAVLNHYADLAHAMYDDSLIGAHGLRVAVERLVAEPSTANLQSAREAWKAARVPYQQTEAFRFGNAIVDDWEGKVNAWPLDEGLIDYVATAYGEESDENPYYRANVIANPRLVLSGRTIDAREITPELISDTLHEVDEIEANVATGYHAIEFLLWGQDLNGTGSGAGNRPETDFDPKRCTGGHCERRAAYLRAATSLLVSDLEWIVAQWSQGGPARDSLLGAGADQGLATIFKGMGSLSYGELAGERMKLGLMLHDPEEEHDCFSDNTHWSHFYDALGIRNVYTGRYVRADGSTLAGPAVADLVAARDAKIDADLRARLEATQARMQILVDSAERDGVAYDQLIGAENLAGNAKVRDAIDALLAQTKAIERAVSVLGLDAIAFEGSDSLDAPDTVK